MEKFVHTSNNMKSIQLDRFVSFIDCNNTPVVIPTLISMSMNKTGCVKSQKTIVNKNKVVEVTIVDTEINPSTINIHEDAILHFLQYVEQQSQLNPDLPNVHMHTHATSEFINTYLNDYLISELKKGFNTVTQRISILTSYYIYLSYLGIAETKNLYIYQKLRAAAHQNIVRSRAYKYIQKDTRNKMLLTCKTIRDELLLRFGFECGLRAIENTSLFMDDFTYAKKPQKGFKSLFDELEQSDKDVFEYLLTITKARKNEGSPARTIYIPRALLEKCKMYYLVERQKETNSNSLLVSTDGKGTAIKAGVATRVFRDIRTMLLDGRSPNLVLNEDNSYHHLRHSFGTEKFYELCRGIPHDSITEGHSVVTEVARLMGHKINKKEWAQEVTIRYIRSIDLMLAN